MEERDDVGVGLFGWLLGVEKPRYFQKGRCVVCGDEWEFCGTTPEELQYHLSNEQRFCPHCNDLSENERADIKRRHAEERREQSESRGILSWLLGV